MSSIKIKVEIEDPKTMRLTQHFAEGALGKTKFDACHTLPGMDLIIKIGEKKYKVSSQHIIEEVIKLHEKIERREVDKK